VVVLVVEEVLLQEEKAVLHQEEKVQAVVEGQKLRPREGGFGGRSSAPREGGFGGRSSAQEVKVLQTEPKTF
jgi:hypothetical protein